MLDIIAWLILFLSAWYDGCTCHADVPGAAEMSSRSRRTYYVRQQSLKRCVMCCRRAPELAVGALNAVLARLLQVSANALDIELVQMVVSDEHRAQIVRDFGIARRHIWGTFQLKFTFWQQLPWHFFGIAHRRMDVVTVVKHSPIYFCSRP